MTGKRNSEDIREALKHGQNAQLAMTSWHTADQSQTYGHNTMFEQMAAALDFGKIQL